MNLLEYKILLETEKCTVSSFDDVHSMPNKDWKLRDIEKNLRTATKNINLLKETYEEENKENAKGVE